MRTKLKKIQIIIYLMEQFIFIIKILKREFFQKIYGYVMDKKKSIDIDIK